MTQDLNVLGIRRAAVEVYGSAYVYGHSQNVGVGMGVGVGVGVGVGMGRGRGRGRGRGCGRGRGRGCGRGRGRGTPPPLYVGLQRVHLATEAQCQGVSPHLAAGTFVFCRVRRIRPHLHLLQEEEDSVL
jgi:hypothetical protein